MPNSNTHLLPCECKSAFQDGRYGPGVRVHNYSPGSSKKGSAQPTWVCTVCGKRKPIEKKG